MTSLPDPQRSYNVLYIGALSVMGEPPPCEQQYNVWFDPETGIWYSCDGAGNWVDIGSLVPP